MFYEKVKVKYHEKVMVEFNGGIWFFDHILCCSLKNFRELLVIYWMPFEFSIEYVIYWIHIEFSIEYICFLPDTFFCKKLKLSLISSFENHEESNFDIIIIYKKALYFAIGNENTEILNFFISEWQTLHQRSLSNTIIKTYFW